MADTPSTNGTAQAALAALLPGDARRNLPLKDAPATTQQQQYEKLRSELRHLIARKRQNDRHLASIEENIYKIETSYLEETPNGNIIRGFDNYIKGSAARRRNVISDSDRLFSQSSVTFVKDETPQSASTAAPTPVSETAPKPSKDKKKKRKKAEDENSSPSGDESVSGHKRSRLSISAARE
ncbi:NuA4-domain-containing protein [Ascobolus immersus RN42]|uniref:Chromatin modification-related protein EAF6 n=1 Tax=Ascobolus immersus RN42 TaxID=1160509 RepID=A0A3N4IVM4_ASCIM|nr:NuA4-domain-containing protein [Ascobolus immersus RN42]